MAGRWQDQVQLVFELGIGATRTPVGLDVWDTALWDRGAVFSGLEPLWEQVPCTKIANVATHGGREYPWDSFDTGTMTVEFSDEENRYAWHPTQSEDLLDLRPGTPVRLSALILATGITYPLYRGYAERIAETIPGGAVITVRIDAQDALGQVGRVDNLEQPAQGGNETTDQRVARLLDTAQWPNEWRQLDPCAVRHIATTLAQPIIEELSLVVWTEAGAVYGDRNGKIRLRSRVWLYEDPHSTTSQKTVGNVGGVCPAVIEWSRSTDLIVNDVGLARVGGQAYVSQDPGSMSRYGKRSWHRYDLSAMDDSVVIQRADALVAERADGRMHIDRVTLEGNAVNDWPFLLSVDYGWQLLVWYRHPVYGWEIKVPVWVQSVDHTIAADSWQVVLGVDDVAPVDTAATRWDVAVWDTGVWEG